MFKQRDHTVIDRTPENDPDIEILFRSNNYSAKHWRNELQQLNTLVCLFSNKYQISDVWGRAYKSNPQILSLRFSYDTLNGMDDMHPIVKLMEAMGIRQDIEQGQYRHLKYSIFTFDASICNALIQAAELLNPDASELEKLSAHGAKRQVLC